MPSEAPRGVTHQKLLTKGSSPASLSSCSSRTPSQSTFTSYGSSTNFPSRLTSHSPTPLRIAGIPLSLQNVLTSFSIPTQSPLLPQTRVQRPNLFWPLNLSQGSVQFGSVAQSCPTPRGFLKLMSIELVMPSNHLILCRPLLLLPSIFPSIRVFSNESALQIRWPTYWSFNFSISPSTEYSALIFFSMDWLDLLAVQGTLKTLLQQLNHSSKASILQRSAFFIAQLSHPYMTTGKTIALTRQTLAGKVMSLLVNMLSRLVIAFLPRSKLF